MTKRGRAAKLLLFLIVLAVGGVYAVRAALPDRMVTTHSAEAYAAYQHGMEHFVQFRYDASDSAFAAATRLDPNFAMAWGRRAMLAITLGREDAAHEYVGRAHACEGGARELERLRIAWWGARADHKTDTEGRAVLTRLLEKYPHDYEGWFAMHEVELAAGHVERAAYCLNQVIENNPTSLLAYNNLGYLYVEMERWDDALEALRKYAFIDSDEANPHDSLGELYERLGRYDEALAEYDKALAADSTFYWSHAHRVRVLNALGRSDEALAHLDRLPDALARGNYAPLLLAQKASINLRLGRVDAARRVVESDGMKRAERVSVLRLIGDIAAVTGDVATARAARDSVIARTRATMSERGETRDVNYPEALAAVAAMESERNYRGAASALASLWKRATGDSEMRRWIAWREAENYWRSAVWDSTIVVCAEPLRVNPNEPCALFWRARALDSAGRSAEADVDWARLGRVWAAADSSHPWVRVMRDRVQRMSS